MPHNRPFEIGLFIPYFEEPWSSQTIGWNQIRDVAITAEAVGFDSVWLPDHLLFRFPHVHAQGMWDVWSLMPALAAITNRVKIAPLVACSSFRNPALIAKMADTIDEISNGRFILGLGAGWHEPEYDAFGFPFDHRVSRFEEALTIIHSLLRHGQIDFEGTYYTARECELRPRGPRPQGPPIVIGSSGPRMLGLMAKYADGWNRDRINDVETLLDLESQVDAACIVAGRDPASLTRTVGIQIDLLNDQRDEKIPRQWIKHPWPLTGSSEQLAEQICAYARARVDQLIIWLDPVSPAAVEAFVPVLELLDR